MNRSLVLPGLAVVGICLYLVALSFRNAVPPSGSPELDVSRVEIVAGNDDDISMPADTDSAELSPTIQSLSAATHLFGVPILVTNTQVESLPETELKLELRGTFASSEARVASALIAERNSESRRYFIGESVPGDAELVSVERELVVLRRNNQDEVLRLPRFGEIVPGPEMAHQDRFIFLQKNLADNPGSYAGTDADAASGSNSGLTQTGIRDSEAGSDDLVLQNEQSERASLADRLAALRARYSNQ